MSWWRRLRRGVYVLLRRGAADRDLAAEVQHYIDEHVAELVASGRSLAEARRIARLQLGDPVNIREAVRAAGWENVAGAVLTDLRHAARRLRKRPSFAIASVLTLALGIGASTAIFSAVNPILFEPLPYPDARRIVTIWDQGADGSRIDVTFGTYRELLARSRSFAALAVLRAWQPTMTGVAEPERIDGQRVSAAYFRVLGVQPVLGREFHLSEDQRNGPGVVILSHGLWQRRYHGDAAVIGRSITLNDRPHTVIGVMASTFENVLSPTAELWVPLQYDESLPPDGREWGHHLRMVGRLRRGVSLDLATADVNRIAEHPVPDLVRAPWAALERGLVVNSLHDDVTRGVRLALLATMGAVLLLLAIACVNVTNLLLAHGAQRRGELALRAALGAGRSRLLAHLVMEGGLLAFLGGALGVAVARLGIEALLAIRPSELPRTSAIRLDGAVFLFALSVTTMVGLVAGVFAALHRTRRELSGSMQHYSGRVAARSSATRRGLVVVEVAFAVVLLVTGGLLMRSLERLLAVDPGFDPTEVLTMRVHASASRFDSDRATQQFFAQALEAVRAVPGVTSAAFTSQLPLTADYLKWGVHFEASASQHEEADGSAFRYAVTPGYFETMGIRLRHGRLLDERDAAGAPGAVLINESFARRTFPGIDPEGQRVRVGSADQPWSFVVGVVSDVKQMSLAVGEENAAYLAAAQAAVVDRALWLVLRARADVASLAPAVRAAIWSVDRDQPISDLATMDDLVARSAAERRFTMIVFQAFALAALVLAAIGLYGVSASGVTERVREIGVRSALGATRLNILGLIARQALSLSGLGVIIGLIGAIAASRAIASLLFGISHLDALTYLGVLLLLLTVSGLATSLPAWRAAHVDPAITLKSD